MKFDAKVPPSLLGLQKWVAQIVARPLRETAAYRLPVYDPETISAIEERISAGPRLTAAQRIGIYNQQYWFRLFVILQEQYPTLIRLFGYEDFNHSIAEPYLLKYVPDHWSLSLLGSKLPQWIDDTYKEEDKSFVLQAALMDEAYERLFNVSVLTPLKKSVLDSPIKKPFYLQRFVALFELDADLFAFREELLSEEPEYWFEHDFPTINWSEKSSYVLYREENTLISEKLSEAQKFLLQAFEKGAFLNEACNCLTGKLAKEAAAHIDQWFYTWAKRGWLTTEVFPEASESEKSRRSSLVFS